MGRAVDIARIYLSEADHNKRGNLMRQILTLLRDSHGIRGVTVFRGVAGFSEAGEVHADDLLRLTVDLPLVIEFFDEPKVVQAAMKLVESLVPGEHIVSWRASLYANGSPLARDI